MTTSDSESAPLFPDNGEQWRRKNLKIIFEDCTFSYKLTHFETTTTAAAPTRHRRRPRVSGIANKIFSKVERVQETLSGEKSYDKCTFFPPNEKDQVKHFVHANLSGLTVGFVNCKFIKRSTTLKEKVIMRLRKFFGLLRFEQDKIRMIFFRSTVIISRCKFRLKDMPIACGHIAGRMIRGAELRI